MKVWPVVFRCLNTGAVHIELNKTYGTDALLLSITAFTSIRGYPTVFYTDRGTQLCKAGKYIDSKEDPFNWTWGKFEETLAARKTKVKFCLSSCQWQNGAAEQSVRALKDALDLTIPNGSGYLDFSEFHTLPVKCADMINSHPIGVTLIDEDLQPLTPNHLLIGCAQSGQVSQEVLTKGDKKYTKRTRYVSELSN